MKQIGLIILIILILTTSNAFAHKDRIERPIRIQFVLENQDTITLTDKDELKIKSYSQDIINGEIKLIMAQLTFNTGEIIKFEYENSQLRKIEIASVDKKAIVPKETIDKIKNIHFQTISLLWDGQDEKAFSANYYFIQFDIGNAKSFNEYPYIQLSFEKENFSKGIVWTPVGINSKQWSNL